VEKAENYPDNCIAIESRESHSGLDRLLADQSLSSESRDFYQKVYQQYQDAVVGFFISRGYSQSEAMDGLQDVYLKVIRLSQPQQLAETPKAYLLKVATNLIRDQYRKRQKLTPFSQDISDLDELPCHQPSPEQQLQTKQQISIVKDAMLELSENHRQIFVMHRMEGMSCNEIAEQTQTPLRTIQRKLSDALAYCVLKIKKEVDLL
tara:strand:- start:20425 stop:21042 length:618 start_codon:yes stop_codon:yes gene_type:complete